MIPMKPILPTFALVSLRVDVRFRLHFPEHDNHGHSFSHLPLLIMFKSITFRSNPNHPKGSVLQVILDLDSWIFQVGAGKEVGPFPDRMIIIGWSPAQLAFAHGQCHRIGFLPLFNAGLFFKPLPACATPCLMMPPDRTTSTRFSLNPEQDPLAPFVSFPLSSDEKRKELN